MSNPASEVYPLLSSKNVGVIADWAVTSLGLTESWRFTNDDGVVEHAEVLWPGGRVSINVIQDSGSASGPSGIALRLDDSARVDAILAKARAAGATILRGPEETAVAYSFTAVDPDGNQWWVNAETGLLDELRGGS